MEYKYYIFVIALKPVKMYTMQKDCCLEKINLVPKFCQLLYWITSMLLIQLHITKLWYCRSSTYIFCSEIYCQNYCKNLAMVNYFEDNFNISVLWEYYSEIGWEFFFTSLLWNCLWLATIFIIHKQYSQGRPSSQSHRAMALVVLCPAPKYFGCPVTKSLEAPKWR